MLAKNGDESDNNNGDTADVFHKVSSTIFEVKNLSYTCLRFRYLDFFLVIFRPTHIPLITFFTFKSLSTITKSADFPTAILPTVSNTPNRLAEDPDSIIEAIFRGIP